MEALKVKWDILSGTEMSQINVFFASVQEFVHNFWSTRPSPTHLAHDIEVQSIFFCFAKPLTASISSWWLSGLLM